MIAEKEIHTYGVYAVFGELLVPSHLSMAIQDVSVFVFDAPQDSKATGPQ